MSEQKTKKPVINYIAICIAIVATIAAIMMYQKVLTIETKLQNQIEAIGSLQRKVREQEQSYNDHHTELKELGTVTKKLSGSENEAILSVQMAIYELELFQDYPKTIEYLNMAKIYTLDKVVLKEIAIATTELQNIPKYNVIEKLKELDEIKSQLVTLDITNKSVAKKTVAIAPNNKALTFLNKFVTISYRDPNQNTVLNPKQRALLESNLLALINQMKAAIANKNSKLLHKSTEQVLNILKTHFTKSDDIAITKAKLEEFSKLELNPKTPNLESILHALHKKNIKQEHSVQNTKDNYPKPNLTVEF